MKLNKYVSYKSCPIPCPKVMPKSKPWRCSAKGYIPCRQTFLTSEYNVRHRFNFQTIGWYSFQGLHSIGFSFSRFEPSVLSINITETLSRKPE